MQQRIRRINHQQSILSRSVAKIQDLWAGAIVQFRYNTKASTTSDKWPLVLIIYLDRKTRLLHCINLNYLPLQVIHLMWRQISEFFGLDVEEKQKGEKKERQSKVELFTREGDMTAGIKLYERVLKPKILERFDCYRTYSLKKIGRIEAIEFDMKVVKEGMTDVSVRDIKDSQEGNLLDYLKDADVLKKGGVQGLKFDKQGKRKENQ